MQRDVASVLVTDLFLLLLILKVFFFLNTEQASSGRALRAHTDYKASSAQTCWTSAAVFIMRWFVSVGGMIWFGCAEMAAYRVLWRRICIFLFWLREEEIGRLSLVHTFILCPSFPSASLCVYCNKWVWRSLRVSMCRVWLLQAVWRCRKVSGRSDGGGKVQCVLASPSLHPLKRLQMCCFEWPFITDSRECRGNYALIFNS